MKPTGFRSIFGGAVPDASGDRTKSGIEIMAQSRLDVVVVGGGIGGLFAANALIAQGLDVSVYEQAPALGEVGAGVFLTPNSVRQLQRVGLGPAVEKCGARVGAGSQYFRHDGAPIAPVQVTDSSGWNATFGMHRADLVEMLAERLAAGVVQDRTPRRRLRADRRRRARVVRQWRRRRRPTSSSPPTAFTPSFGSTWRRRRVRCSTARSPIAACCRMR